MTSHSDLFEALPGVETPVGRVLNDLSAMWNAPAGSGGAKPPSEFRASRMNLILHLGFHTGVEEAKARFNSVIAFSRRYPCRVLVICPKHESSPDGKKMECKIFSECYIGPSRSDMSCCEAIIIGYPLEERRFLENQVSIFLETDLPTYYWPCRWDSAERLSDYQTFFKESSRVIVDSALETFSLSEIKLPQPEKLHDLAYSRLLPVRQCVGQFLSSFSTQALITGLKSVTLSSCPGFSAEGRALLGWIRGVLKECGADLEAVSVVQDTKEADGFCPRLIFEYDGESHVDCQLNFEKREARIEACIGSECHNLTATAKLLDIESALAEAMFFE